MADSDDNSGAVASSISQAAAALSAVATSLSEVVTKMNSTMQSLSENVDKLGSMTDNIAKAGENVQEAGVTSSRFLGSQATDTRFTEKDAHSASTSFGSDHTSVKHDSDIETTEAMSAFNAQLVAYNLSRRQELDRLFDRIFTNALTIDERVHTNAITYDNAVAIGNLTVDALVKALQNLSPSVTPPKM